VPELISDELTENRVAGRPLRSSSTGKHKGVPQSFATAFAGLHGGRSLRDVSVDLPSCLSELSGTGPGVNTVLSGRPDAKLQRFLQHAARRPELHRSASDCNTDPLGTSRLHPLLPPVIVTAGCVEVGQS
jgi:hypothetical protein